MVATTMVALIVAIKNHNHNPELRLITYYIGLALVTDLISIYSEFFVKDLRLAGRVDGFAIAIFMIFEVILFYIYFYNNIRSNASKFFLKLLFISFFVICFYLCEKKSILFSPAQSSFGIMVGESLCLVIPCLFYFHDLFLTRNLILKNHKSFWIVTGILFYNSCSIPIFLLISYIQLNLPQYANIFLALNYILNSVLFGLFIKAYLCRKPAITSL